MDNIKKMMKQVLQIANNAVTDAHLEAIEEDRMMTVAEWEEIMVNTLIANGVTIPVRCKDCAVPHNRFTGCPNLNGLIPPQDFFCAYGKRRTDD